MEATKASIPIGRGNLPLALVTCPIARHSVVRADPMAAVSAV